MSFSREYRFTIDRESLLLNRDQRKEATKNNWLADCENRNFTESPGREANIGSVVTDLLERDVKFNGKEHLGREDFSSISDEEVEQILKDKLGPQKAKEFIAAHNQGPVSFVYCIAKSSLLVTDPSRESQAVLRPEDELSTDIGILPPTPRDRDLDLIYDAKGHLYMRSIFSRIPIRRIKDQVIIGYINGPFECVFEMVNNPDSHKPEFTLVGVASDNFDMVRMLNDEMLTPEYITKEYCYPEEQLNLLARGIDDLMKECASYEEYILTIIRKEMENIADGVLDDIQAFEQMSKGDQKILDTLKDIHRNLINNGPEKGTAYFIKQVTEALKDDKRNMIWKELIQDNHRLKVAIEKYHVLQSLKSNLTDKSLSYEERLTEFTKTFEANAGTIKKRSDTRTKAFIKAVISVLATLGTGIIFAPAVMAIYSKATTGSLAFWKTHSNIARKKIKNTLSKYRDHRETSRHKKPK